MHSGIHKIPVAVMEQVLIRVICILKYNSIACIMLLYFIL